MNSIHRNMTRIKAMNCAWRWVISELSVFPSLQGIFLLLSLEENWPLQWIPRFFLIYLATKFSKIEVDLTKSWVEELSHHRVVPEPPPRSADHVHAIKIFGHNFSNIQPRKHFFTSFWCFGTWEACFWWVWMPSRHIGEIQASIVWLGQWFYVKLQKLSVFFCHELSANYSKEQNHSSTVTED